MLQGKIFGSNEEVIAETETYFESKDESFCKKGIEKLEKHWNECITVEGKYADKKSQISRKNCVFLSQTGNLLNDVLVMKKMSTFKVYTEIHTNMIGKIG